MTSDENALLDRVIVNRLWAQLFGRGIVGTVDNFGVQGENPRIPRCSTISPRSSAPAAAPSNR
jgi:hypothetical protein